MFWANIKLRHYSLTMIRLLKHAYIIISLLFSSVHVSHRYFFLSTVPAGYSTQLIYCQCVMLETLLFSINKFMIINTQRPWSLSIINILMVYTCAMNLPIMKHKKNILFHIIISFGSQYELDNFLDILRARSVWVEIVLSYSYIHRIVVLILIRIDFFFISVDRLSILLNCGSIYARVLDNFFSFFEVYFVVKRAFR